MPFLDHLEEFRRVLLTSALAILLCTAVCWFFSGQILDWVVIRTIGHAQFLRPTEAFSTRFKIAFFLGFLASFVGTTTGGIGLLVVPALIVLGFPPHTAIGTTRFAVFAGDIVSLDRLNRAGKADRTIALPILLFSLVGAVIGSVILLRTPGPLAEKLLGVFILATLIFTILQRDVGLRAGKPPTTGRKLAGYSLMFFLSILAAYFSAAIGILGRTTLMTFFGQTYLQSAATRKIQGIGIGIVTLLIYAWSGIIDPVASLALVPSMLLGSWMGSVYALRKGDVWARGLFLIVVFLAAVQLLF